MATFSVNWSAVLSPLAGTVSRGQALVNSAAGYLGGTTANRGTKRCSGVAATDGDASSSNPTVVLIEAGVINPAISGLPAGAQEWVRVSSSGALERVTTPGAGDDLIGKAEADGSVHLHPGVWDSTNYTSTGGGGGASLPIDLADPGSVTGVLPKANQAAQDMAGDVTGTTAASTVAKISGTTPAVATVTWLGTPSGANLASALTSALPDTKGGTGLTALGTNIASFLAVNVSAAWNTFAGTPSGANLASLLSSALPASKGGTGLTALGTNIAAYLAVNVSAAWNTFAVTPTGANLAALLTSALPVSKGGTGLTALTIPASALLVGTTDAQTLTTKTIVAASNTITDTSAATGDILRHDGTRFVRLARGSANQVLQTNAGGTDIAWATVGGGSLGTNVTSGSEYIAIATGGGAVATAGNIRTPTGGGSWRFRDSTNSVDTYALQCVADNLYIGCDSGFSANQPSTTNVYALAAVALGIGGTTYQYLTGGVVEHWKPAVGSSSGSSPWGAVDGMAQVAVSTLPITLTAAQYSRQVTKFTGAPAATRTITYPLPASDDETYVKTVWGQQTVSSLTITNGGGLTVSIAANSAPHTLLFTTGGVILLT